MFLFIFKQNKGTAQISDFKLPNKFDFGGFFMPKHKNHGKLYPYHPKEILDALGKSDEKIKYTEHGSEAWEV